MSILNSATNVNRISALKSAKEYAVKISASMEVLSDLEKLMLTPRVVFNKDFHLSLKMTADKHLIDGKAVTIVFSQLTGEALHAYLSELGADND